MQIYIDETYRCHTEAAEGLVPVNTPFFDGKCRAFIEGFCFEPTFEQYQTDSGETYDTGMITPWVDYSVLESAQREYEEALAEAEDMRQALEILEVQP